MRGMPIVAQNYFDITKNVMGEVAKTTFIYIGKTMKTKRNVKPGNSLG